MALDDYKDKLDAAIESKKVDKFEYKPRTSKSDFLDYFGSSRKAAEYLHELGLVRNKKTGEAATIKSLMRRFQLRGEKSQGENSPVYQAAGAALPAKKTLVGRELPSQYTITVSGSQGTGDGGTRERTFRATFKGGEARAFGDSPSFRAFFYHLKYDSDVVDRFDDGDYALEVESVA